MLNFVPTFRGRSSAVERWLPKPQFRHFQYTTCRQQRNTSTSKYSHFCVNFTAPVQRNVHDFLVAFCQLKTYYSLAYCNGV
jgi:hypothetical protein